MPGRDERLQQFVGERLRARRETLSLSQQQLGTLVGVSASEIGSYEAGVRRLEPTLLLDIAQHLHVPMGFFFDPLLQEAQERRECQPISFGTPPDCAATEPEAELQETLDLVRAVQRIRASPHRRRTLTLLATVETMLHGAAERG